MIGQVGGLSEHKKTLLSVPPSYLMKPVRQDHRGIREIHFYEALKMSAETAKDWTQSIALKGARLSPVLDILDNFAIWIALRVLRDPDVVDCKRRVFLSRCVLEKHQNLLKQLHPFLPQYFGVIERKPDEASSSSPKMQALNGRRNELPTGISYLMLEDITAKYKKPCTIDIKMGKQSYEPDADKEKQEREIKKYPQQKEFGLRIVGMRVYDPAHKEACSNGFVFFTKHYGRSLRARAKLKQALQIFFRAGSSVRSLACVLAQLREIKDWFVSNDSFSFYASSLLISYEAEWDNSNRPQNMATVKMIDFGRVQRQDGGDEGYLLGLNTMTTLLEEVLSELSGQVRG